MAKGEPKTAPREYVVLKRSDLTEGEFNQFDIVTATSAARAIDEAREGAGGRWVAVALSKWNELDLEVVQRDPTVKRTRMHPGQTQIEMPTEVMAPA